MGKREFIERMRVAGQDAKARGARLNIVAVTAQAAHESAWGSSQLAIQANNLWGIKAGSKWTGPVVRMATREWSRQRGWYMTGAAWRAYETWTDSIMDYARLLALSWFRDALPHADPPHGDGDPVAWIRALLPEPGQPGWATDPRYLAKVTGLYEPEDLVQAAPPPAVQVQVGAVLLAPEAVELKPNGQVWVALRPYSGLLNVRLRWDAPTRMVMVEEGAS